MITFLEKFGVDPSLNAVIKTDGLSVIDISAFHSWAIKNGLLIKDKLEVVKTLVGLSCTLARKNKKNSNTEISTTGNNNLANLINEKYKNIKI